MKYDSAKVNMDSIGKVVDLLVKTIDKELHLSEKEKCVIVDSAFGGLHNVLDKRYKKLLHYHYIDPSKEI